MSAEERNPLDITIIGGSLAGLFTAILLKRQGHNITIYEAASSSTREGQAAGIGFGGQVKSFFDQNDRLAHVPFGIPNETYEVLGPDMQTLKALPLGYRMTTWDATYYRLRANFDGMKCVHCPEPPAMDAGEGKGTFETGIRVLRVEELGSKVLITYMDVRSGNKSQRISDIVIAADGVNSTVRRQLHPEIQREEPGFLIWRGIAPAKSLSAHVLSRIEGKTIMHPMKSSYIVMYMLPGINGSLEQEDLQVNFAWYDYPIAHTSIASILTDVKGHPHRTTLPKGGMRPETWSAQLARAKEMLHPELLEVVMNIEDPFVSVVSSVEYPNAVYMDAKLFFVGDALVQFQPNTGQGTNHAAMEAMSLAKVFEGTLTTADWEKQVQENAHTQRVTSQQFPKQWME